MASAWGSAFGLAWGLAWGGLASPPPVIVTGGAAGRRRRRPPSVSPLQPFDPSPLPKVAPQPYAEGLDPVAVLLMIDAL